MDINESPVYVLLNPAINHAHKDLPVTIYESGKSFFSIFLLLYCLQNTVVDCMWPHDSVDSHHRFLPSSVFFILLDLQFCLKDSNLFNPYHVM